MLPEDVQEGAPNTASTCHRLNIESGRARPHNFFARRTQDAFLQAPAFRVANFATTSSAALLLSASAPEPSPKGSPDASWSPPLSRARSKEGAHRRGPAGNPMRARSERRPAPPADAKASPRVKQTLAAPDPRTPPTSSWSARRPRTMTPPFYRGSADVAEDPRIMLRPETREKHDKD